MSVFQSDLSFLRRVKSIEKKHSWENPKNTTRSKEQKKPHELSIRSFSRIVDMYNDQKVAQLC